jgi:cobalt-zinc-cadmium efflux system outer membrane protein
MKVLARWERVLGPAAPVLLAACATTGQGSYDTMREEVNRASAADQHVVVEDDGALQASVLDRATYVRVVLHRNPTIESARQGWRAAIARIRQSGALEDPMVTLEVAPLSIGSSSAPLGYTAMVSQRLPWPGKLSLDESVARAEAEAMRSDFEGAQRELALTAALLYGEYFVAVRSLEINALHVALMRDLKAGALAQFVSGRASAQDPLQAEAELTHMEHDAVLLASHRDIAVAQMNELLHRDPDLPLPPPPRDVTVTAIPDSGSAVRLADEAVKRRPEIEAMRLHARAEQARAERANRESYPDLSVSTSYNSMWDTPEHRWMVGVSVNVPIQLGRRAGGVEEANAARARFDSETARLTDKARTEVAVALKRLEESAHVLRLYEERLVPVARDQVDAARAGFVVSRNDFVAVIAAEKNLRSVELDYQMTRATFDQRRAELDRALGRVPGIDDKEVAR